jgi:hypothetical protein
MNTSKITHTAITNGTKVYVAGGISGSNVLDKIEFYDISVGINDPSFFENFTLFPNPSSNVIHFNIPKEFIGYQYSIINGLGITIFNSEINEIETNIDISQYPVGIYFLKIEGGKQPALKFIKK